MKAVIFGAGNIGRGFICPLFHEAGYEVVFLDVVPEVISDINNKHEYSQIIVSNDGSKINTINNIRAIDSNNKELAVKELTECDIAATCVGAKALKYIVPNLSFAIKERMEKKIKPLNLLLCENLMDANIYMEKLLSDQLNQNEMNNIGLIETSVGRMVPKLEVSGNNKLDIAVEPYCILPVDKDAFKGDVPTIKNLYPASDFKFFVDRKLYLHNMGHAICAYLGDYMGYKYIWESIENPYIRIIVKNSMIESAVLLSKQYHKDILPILDHADDLIRRFGNKALGDTCERVGADIPRKMSSKDRLVGPANEIIEGGSFPINISTGIAAAIFEYIKEENKVETTENSIKIFSFLSGADQDSQLSIMVQKRFVLFQKGCELKDIISFNDTEFISEHGMIV